MKSIPIEKTTKIVAAYFDGCKVGCFGNKGFRKTTDLSKFSACIDDLSASGIIDPASTVFADLGCGDGRVNFLMSYFVKISVGIEIDSEILSEYSQREDELLPELAEAGAMFPPENIYLYRGSSLDDATFREIQATVGVSFDKVDLFYTYITLHDVFAEKIAECARPGAYYLVYGFSKVLPQYDSFDLVNPDVGGQGIAALYRKKGG